MPRKLSIDIETFSTRDIKKGMYVYAEHCEIILFACAYDDEPVQIYDTWCEDLPDSIMRDLTNPEVIKHAFNAPFEIECIEQFFKLKLDPMEWRCTLVRSAMCGLPLSLDAVAQVMGLAQQKDANGKKLINLFCTPQSPTAKNKHKTRIMPYDEPAQWKEFRKYCVQDVIVEREVSKGLQFYGIQRQEHEYWCMDQRMNKRGVLVSQDLARAAIELDRVYKIPIVEECKKITGLLNPKSPKPFAAWLTQKTGIEVTSVAKDVLEVLVKKTENPEVLRAIKLKLELSKTSVSKYAAMLLGINLDGRLRGCFQYYGANRTGRAAGRLVQLHNMPKTHYKDIDSPRRLALERDAEFIEFIYGDIPNVLSKLIRTAFIASPGKLLKPVDFNSIEARITAWLAGEEWRLEAFARGVNIYSLSAAKTFKLTVEECGKGTKMYDVGKIEELALGFGGGVNAMLNFGADRLGLSVEELDPIKKAWRLENPKIVALWRTLEKAAKHCIKTGETVTLMYGIKFSLERGFMFIRLPSGRKLSYHRPQLEEDEGSDFGPRITYWGLHQESKKWVKLDTYGGKLTENIVQAIGRDLLYHGTKKLEDAGYDIVMHVHDEAVVEDYPGDVEKLEKIMSINPEWAPGLPLAAEGFESPYYKK